MRRAKRVVRGLREQRAQSAEPPDRQGDRRDQRDESDEARQTRRREGEVEQQQHRERDPAAAREGEEEGEAHGHCRRGGDGAQRRVSPPVAGDREGHPQADHHHQREDVPVPDGAVQAGVGVRVRDDGRKRFAQEGVDADRRGHGKVAVSDGPELQRPRRGEPQDGHDRQVERGQVERHPGEIGAERPQHREPGPDDEGGEEAESRDEKQRRPRAAAKEPHPHGSGAEQGHHDRRAAPEHIPAGEERERRHRRKRQRERNRVPGPERRPATRAVFTARLHRRDYTVILSGGAWTAGESQPAAFQVWSSTRASGTSEDALPRRSARGGVKI